MDEKSVDSASLPKGDKPHRPAPFSARRVLVREVNWLGDLVLSLPALRAIRAIFDRARLSVLVADNLVGFFDGIDWIDEVIPYRSSVGAAGLKYHFKISSEISAREFDLAILFPGSFRSALWVMLAGVPVRIGYTGDGRGFMLTHRVSPGIDALAGHQSRYWLGLVRDVFDCDESFCDRPQTLTPSPQNVSAMRSWLAMRRIRQHAKLIAIAPAAAYGPAKEWPSAHYVALIDLLAERYGAECVLVGSSSERGRCEQLAASARAGAIVAAGETGVGELIALLSLCDGFAGNDSGAMHLAAALSLPTVGIFGSTNPARTGPVGQRADVIYRAVECSPCLDRTCRFGHYNCLREIAPAEVADSLARLGGFATQPGATQASMA